jgi:hypothetical protein
MRSCASVRAMLARLTHRKRKRPDVDVADPHFLTVAWAYIRVAYAL